MAVTKDRAAVLRGQISQWSYRDPERADQARRELAALKLARGVDRLEDELEHTLFDSLQSLLAGVIR